MGIHNSLDVYTSLVTRLHRDIAERCVSMGIRYPAHDQKLDELEIVHRCTNEGIEFLTKTLPSMGKAIDIALSGNGALEVPGFKKARGSKLPKFLGSLLSMLFDADGRAWFREDAQMQYNSDYSSDGVDEWWSFVTVYQEGGVFPYTKQPLGHSALVLRYLRTFLYFAYKLELPNDKEADKTVLNSFIQTERELANHQLSSDALPMLYAASELLAVVLRGVSDRDIKPDHGPGAVATGETGLEKSNFSRSYKALNWYYPEREYFFNGYTHLYRANGRSLENRDEATAKVVLVPKDSRGPRLISCEPLEIQWIQQGLMQNMVTAIESHPLTKGQVNFTCQEINRELARAASTSWLDDRTRGVKYSVERVDDIGRRFTVERKINLPRGVWVTLDMKDASDRVSLDLVKRLFALTTVVSGLLASRSTSTLLPDGRRVELRKFAPMGSAVCFPVEALSFFALAIASIIHQNPSMRTKDACKRVFVYGDDLIVRREDYPAIVQLFESVGLKFNEKKCCVSGFFRESCGLDAYLGVDVSPIRLRKTWGHRGVKHPVELVSYVSLTNSLLEKGYWRAAEYLHTLITARYGLLPAVEYSVSVEEDIPSPQNPTPTTRVIGFNREHVYHLPCANITFKNQPEEARDWQVKFISGWVVEPVFKKDRIDGWNEYFRWLASGHTGSDRGVYAVPHRSRLKRGWGRSHK